MPISNSVQKLCSDSRGQYRRIIAQKSRFNCLPALSFAWARRQAP